MKITAKNISLLGKKVNNLNPQTLDELYKVVFDTEMKLSYGCGPEYENAIGNSANKITSFSIFNSTEKKFTIVLDNPIYLTDL